MQPIGRVISKEPGRVSVLLVRQSACQNCRSCSLGSSENSTITVVAEDLLGAEIGQSVQIQLPPAQGVRAALLVYTVPLFVLFGAYFLLANLPLPGGELIPAAGSIVCAFSGFFLLRVNEDTRKNDPRYMPRVEAVIDSE